MTLLLLDTSADFMTISILSKDKLFVNIEIEGLSFSKYINIFTDKLFEMANLTLSDISGFVVTKGPGNFTSLRVGISFINGLSFVTKKPSLGISTLFALSLGLDFPNSLICPTVDAKGGYVYSALFLSGKRILEDKVYKISDLFLDLPKDERKIVFVGNGSNKYRDEIEKKLGKRAIILGEKVFKVDTYLLGKYAMEKIQRIPGPNLIEPVYLKNPYGK